MKYLALILLLGLGSALTGQRYERVVRDFIQEHRQGPENFAIKVPGWMIGLTGGIGTLAADNSEDRAAFALLREVGTTRVVIFDHLDFPHPGQSIENLLFSLEHYHGFDRWAEIRTSTGEHVRVSALYRGARVDHLLIAVREEMETVLVSAKTDLTAAELGRIMRELSEGEQQRLR